MYILVCFVIVWYIPVIMCGNTAVTAAGLLRQFATPYTFLTLLGAKCQIGAQLREATPLSF